MKFLFLNFLFIFFFYHSLLLSQQCENKNMNFMNHESNCISYAKDPIIRVQNKAQEKLTLYLFYCTSEVSSTESIESMLYCSETLTEHFNNIQKTYFYPVLKSKEVPLKQPHISKDLYGEFSSIPHYGYETYEIPVDKTTLIPIERPITQKKAGGSSIKYYLGDKVFIIVTRGETAPCFEKKSSYSYIGSNHYTGDWALMNIDNHYFTQYLPWFVSSSLMSGLNKALSYFGAYSGWLDPEKLYHSNAPVALSIDNYDNVQLKDLDKTSGAIENNQKAKSYCSLTIHANMAGPEDISTFYME